jgi:DNA replication and repair protein RecF
VLCGPGVRPPAASTRRRWPSATRCWPACAPAARARRWRPGTAAELGLAGAAELRYRPRTRAGSPEALAAELAERLDADLERGFTTHGPHRDDVALLRDGRELRAYGSQGEQRMGLLALLLAERAVLEDERGAPPLLLLDDVMSELDFGRRERLVERLRAGQALVTTTDVAHVPGADEDDVVRLRVEDGVVTSQPIAA